MLKCPHRMRANSTPVRFPSSRGAITYVTQTLAIQHKKLISLHRKTSYGIRSLTTVSVRGCRRRRNLVMIRELHLSTAAKPTTIPPHRCLAHSPLRRRITPWVDQVSHSPCMETPDQVVTRPMAHHTGWYMPQHRLDLVHNSSEIFLSRSHCR